MRNLTILEKLKVLNNYLQNGSNAEITIVKNQLPLILQLLEKGFGADYVKESKGESLNDSSVTYTDFFSIESRMTKEYFKDIQRLHDLTDEETILLFEITKLIANGVVGSLLWIDKIINLLSERTGYNEEYINILFQHLVNKGLFHGSKDEGLYGLDYTKVEKDAHKVDQDIKLSIFYNRHTNKKTYFTDILPRLNLKL